MVNVNITEHLSPKLDIPFDVYYYTEFYFRILWENIKLLPINSDPVPLNCGANLPTWPVPLLFNHGHIAYLFCTIYCWRFVDRNAPSWSRNEVPFQREQAIMILQIWHRIWYIGQFAKSILVAMKVCYIHL